MPQNPASELSGQTAVVTGSSSGIGRAIALELAAAGAHVLVHARASREAAEAVAAEVAACGVESHVVLCDLADGSTHEPLVERAWRWRGQVDVWVNNAGADILTGEAAAWDFQQKLDQLLKVDVAATLNLSRAAGARMKSRGSGAIVNVGWDQAEHGMAGDSGQLFAAAKGAVMAMTRSLAHSLRPRCASTAWPLAGFRPGGARRFGQMARAGRGEALLARWGQSEDVAAAVRFLVSPAAAFITAQTLAVNGGFKQA